MGENKAGWTNASVVAFAAGGDPIAKMEQRARLAVLDAVDQGWRGPPFDPIELANIMEISVRPNPALADARVFWTNEGYQIEYNPHRPRSRVNFSIAHEIAHTFFPDCAAEVRNRSRERLEEPNWQIEVLCNLGAAELTMPVGSFPSGDEDVVTIEQLMCLRKNFRVSAEAVLIRLAKLASSRVACFSATRLPKRDHSAEYRINYQIESSHWLKDVNYRMPRRVRSDVLDECLAIGSTSKGSETWQSEGLDFHVEAVALPPLPGTKSLRIAGFMRPASERPEIGGIEYRHGNAANFATASNVAIVHIVNDKAQHWGPQGFARVLRLEHPSAYSDYASWKRKSPNAANLGSVHMVGVPGENRYVVSLVAQKGYGKSVGPRIQYGALDAALQIASERLWEEGVQMVQMPKIGTGQARGNWQVIEGLIRERLVSAGFEVRVIELPPR